MVRTGYFASTTKYTKVHLVDEFSKPLCNNIIGADMKFQFNANFAALEYVECGTCKKIHLKKLNHV